LQFVEKIKGVFFVDKDRVGFLYKFFFKWHFPIILAGFFLGRAMVFNDIAPFSLPYLAVISYFLKSQWFYVLFSFLLGMVTFHSFNVIYRTIFFIFLFFLFKKVFRFFNKDRITYTPFLVLFSSFLGYSIYFCFVKVNLAKFLYASLEVLLSFILSFIFLQALPFLIVKKRRFTLRTEEIVCFIILFGSILTGCFGIKVFNLSVVNILARFLVILLSLIGGATLSASMGVVIGLILSLSHQEMLLQIGLLSFSGLLAGLFKEGKRIFVALGFLLGSVIFSFYEPLTPNIFGSIQETLGAILLFLFFREKWFKKIASYIPGTKENQSLQYDYIKRVRNITALKV